MLKFSLDRLRKKNKFSFALKSTFLFMTAFMLALILFSAVMTIIFSYRSDAILTKSNTWALEHLAAFTDKYLFEKIDYLCDTYFNLNSKNERMQTFFSEMENMSAEEMQNMQRDLIEIKRQNSFLDNIILYNGQFDSLVSSDDNIVYGATDSRNHLSIQNRFFTYLNEITTDFYVPQDDNIMLENQKNSILYVHYVSSDETHSFGNKHVNCVIMAVDIASINSFIKEINIPEIQCFAIMDKNSKALIHSDTFPGIDSIKNDSEASYNKIISLPRGSYKMKFQNAKANYIWVQSKIKDWKYIYIISTSEWYRQLLIIVICIVCTTLLILLLVYIIMSKLSRKIYKPFNDVVEKAKIRLENEAHSDNEIELLNNVIDDFSQKNMELALINTKYSELRLHQLSTKIINGFISDTPEKIINQLSSAGIDFSSKIYSLIIIEFNEEILNNFSSEQSDFILYDVMDVLYETFNCIVALSSSKTIDLVINSDHADYEAIIKTFKRLIPEKSLINLYLCGQTENITEIGKLYNKASGLTKYSYIHGFDNTFYISELLECELDNSIIDPQKITCIENALRNGNKTQFYDKCNDILTDVKKDKHSFAYAQNVILRILSVICRVARESGISVSEEDAFKKIMSNSFFDNSTVYLFDLSDKVFDALTEKMSSKEEDRRYGLIGDIKEYIDKHITEDISLASVAQKFNISAGYLSKFFKENTSESFSKYMIEKKFSYAAQMLLVSPNRSITDIANDLGYFDTAYFSRQFKAHYGVTPVQYRKMNH